MFEVVVILKALTEVAAVAMLGQGLLWVLAGSGREENLVYKLFKTLTSPVNRLARFITPRVVLDRHLWLVSVLFVSLLWLTLTVLKINMVLEGAAAR